MSKKQPIALFVFSNDLDRYLSKIETERKAIESALEQYHDTNRLKVILRSSVSIMELMRLFQRYHGQIVLFHFSGHAGGEGLQLNQTTTDNEVGYAQGIAGLIKKEVEEGQLEFVFLNGCSTKPQVEALKNAGVKSIIATNFPINDNKAAQFSGFLYKTLANKAIDNPLDSESINIKQAFEAAENYLQTTNQAPNISKTDRGFVFETNSNSNQEPWELFSAAPTWHLPNEVVNIILPPNQKRVGQSKWTQSLEQALKKQGVAVRPKTVFERYGWLIETFLQKMETRIGKQPTSRRLSFMAEAFQSSVRYLCYIQIAQLLRLEEPPVNLTLQNFLSLSPEQQAHTDYFDLLLVATDLLEGKATLIPEINELLEEFYNDERDFRNTVYFLQDQRNQLLKGKIEETNLEVILEEYLTALVLWLRKIAFIAKYRLVSIKDIQLNYRLGTTKQFVHLYGELHGMYGEAGMSRDDDYTAISVENDCTYNQSILLFKAKNMETALENIEDKSTYLSLSPLIIDQSVFSVKPTQTPEIHYYIGQENGDYHYAQYKNELSFDNKKITSNKFMVVEEQNNDQPKLDELFEQIDLLFNPFND
jgi:hypothetical protein